MKELRIDERFNAACPPLSDEEFKRLESLILKDGVIYNPILVWDDVIIDGHNRYQIAKKHGIGYSLNDISFESDEEAIIWIKENAISQRNLPDFVKIELAGEIEALLKQIGKEKQATSTGGNKPQLLSRNNKTKPEPHNTQKELATKLGMSTGQIAKAKVIEQEADEETKEDLREGKVTINKAYTKIKEHEKKEDSEIDLLEKGAKSLGRWINNNSDKEPLFEFIPLIDNVIIAIRDKKTTYA